MSTAGQVRCAVDSGARPMVVLSPAVCFRDFLNLLKCIQRWDNAALLGRAHLLAAVLVTGHHHAGYSPSLSAVMGSLALIFNRFTSKTIPQIGRPVVLHLPKYGALLF